MRLRGVVLRRVLLLRLRGIVLRRVLLLRLRGVVLRRVLLLRLRGIVLRRVLLLRLRGIVLRRVLLLIVPALLCLGIVLVCSGVIVTGIVLGLGAVHRIGVYCVILSLIAGVRRIAALLIHLLRLILHIVILRVLAAGVITAGGILSVIVRGTRRRIVISGNARVFSGGAQHIALLLQLLKFAVYLFKVALQAAVLVKNTVVILRVRRNIVLVTLLHGVEVSGKNLVIVLQLARVGNRLVKLAAQFSRLTARGVEVRRKTFVVADSRVQALFKLVGAHHGILKFTFYFLVFGSGRLVGALDRGGARLHLLNLVGVPL